MFTHVSCLCVCLVVVFGQAPPIPVSNNGQAPPLAIVDNSCKDNIDSCASFPASACKEPYLEWAQKNCKQTCKFCVGPSTAAPPCVDTKKNCEIYTQSVCNKTEYNSWVNENCRAYCRRCTGYDAQHKWVKADNVMEVNVLNRISEQLAHLTTTTTTIAPKDCFDKVDCRTYGSNACAKSFEDWSQENCPLTCGYCVGTPTTPPLCVDRIPNCKAYNPSTCTDPDFKIWVEDNCKKFCKIC